MSPTLATRPLPVVPVALDRSFPPRVSDFTRPFWTALDEGRFLMTRCAACDRHSFPPKPFCPHCWHQEVRWVAVSEGGSLYSQTQVHAAPAAFAAEAPFRLCLVDLDVGVRIACRLVADHAPALDTRVELVVLRYRDGPLFGVRPVA